MVLQYQGQEWGVAILMSYLVRMRLPDAEDAAVLSTIC